MALNSARVKIDLAGLNAHMEEQAKAFVRRGQLAAQRELQEIYGPQWGERTGRVYKRGDKLHQASAPDEAPAVDSGRLRQSVAMHPLEVDGHKVIGAVGVATPYAEHLEIGTERMAPRPGVSRLEEQERAEKIGRIAAQAIKS